MAMNPMLATLLTAGMNKGGGSGNPNSMVDSFMSILTGPDSDGVFKGIGFGEVMKRFPQVANTAMDLFSAMKQSSPGDMETPEDEGAEAGPMGPMPMGGPPMPPPMMPGPLPGGPMPGGNPMQALAALLAARRGAPTGPPSGPGGGASPLADLMLRRG